jgi:hypothetical protein
MIILASILLILAVYIVARWTNRRIKRGEYIDHRHPAKEWLIKASSGIPAIVFFCLVKFWQPSNVWLILISGLMSATWYWILFDSFLGLMLKKGIFYTGTVWAGQAKTANVPFVAKVVLVILSTAGYILIRRGL